MDMMTQSKWYERPRDAQGGIAFMEDSGWAVRQLVSFTGPNAFPNFTVVFERDVVKRPAVGWDNER